MEYQDGLEAKPAGVYIFEETRKGTIDNPPLPDGYYKAYYNLEFIRPSKAYTFDHDILFNDTPALVDFTTNVHAFTDLESLSPTVTVAADVVAPTYAEALVLIKDLADTHTSQGLVYEDLTTLQGNSPLASGSGREHPAISYKIDSERPLLIFQIASHGDEQHALLGMLEWMEQVLDVNNTNTAWVRDNLAIMGVCIQNPDGWALVPPRRRNGIDASTVYEGVNLNRNWDYFWDYASDPDKGSTVFSEIETTNFKNWMETLDLSGKSRIDRGVWFIDFHSWTSRDTYAWLQDHNFIHGFETQELLQAGLQYTNNLLATRDWTGYPLNIGESNQTMIHRSSSRKPYANYWAHQRFQKFKGTTCQIELPQAESQAVNLFMILDIMHGVSLAIQDHWERPVRKGITVDTDVPAASIMNNNSLLEDWSSSENRPQWFTQTGLVLQDGDNETNIVRPTLAAFPEQIMKFATASYIDPADDNKSFFVTIGGSMETNPSDVGRTYMEPFLPPLPPAIDSPEYATYRATVPQTQIAAMDVLVTDSAAVYCIDTTDGNGYIYHFFGEIRSGEVDTGVRSDEIHRLLVQDDMTLSNWELVKVSTYFTSGLRRHKVITWNNVVYIVGGNTPTGYSNKIVKFDPSDDTETALILDLPATNGWFDITVSATDSNIFYYLGGYGGVTLKDDFYKFTFSGVDTYTQTQLTDMPSARSRFTVSATANKVTVLGGYDTTSTTFSTNILSYDITGNTWETLAVDPDGGAGLYRYDDVLVDDEDPFGITDLGVARVGGVYNPYTGVHYCIGGFRPSAAGDTRTNTFFEFDIEDISLSARIVNDVSWGTFKPTSSAAQTSDLPTSVMVTTTNQTDWELDPDSIKLNAYNRPTLYVGTTFASTVRWRNKYMITPAKKRITLPVYAPPSGQPSPRSYSYHRQYGAGTKTKVSSMQMLENRLPTPRAIPLTGMGRERAEYTLTGGTSSYISQVSYYTGSYMLVINNNFAVEVPVVAFYCPTHTVELYHVMGVVPEEPTKVAGDIVVKVRLVDTNEIYNEAIIGNIGLNYDSATNVYKREIVNFKITTSGTLVLELWYYGKRISYQLSDFIGGRVFGNFGFTKIVPLFVPVFPSEDPPATDTITGMYFTLDGIENTFPDETDIVSPELPGRLMSIVKDSFILSYISAETLTMDVAANDVFDTVGDITHTVHTQPTQGGTVTVIDALAGTFLYTPPAAPFGGTVTWQYKATPDDAPNFAEIGDVTIDVNANAPVISNTSAMVGYINGDVATLIDAITVTDTDSDIASATVTISTGYVDTEDELLFVNTSNIFGTFNGGTGVLTLSGVDTVAAYQTALSSVQYINTEVDTPNTTTRTISWVTYDGYNYSNTITNDISVTIVINYGTPTISTEFDNPAGTVDSGFGGQVDIHGDRVIVGEFDFGNATALRGRAYLLDTSVDIIAGDAANNVIHVYPDGNADDVKGSAVGINSTVTAIGSWGFNGLSTNAGQVQVYSITSPYGLEYTISNPNQRNVDDFDRFGIVLCLTDDYLAVAAPLEGNTLFDDNGTVYVFNPADGALLWQIQNPSVGADETNFGAGLDILGDVLVIGEDYENDITPSGRVHIYDLTDGSLTRTIIHSDHGGLYPYNAQFGRRVSLSEDYVLVGAYRENSTAPLAPLTDAGKAYLFNLSDGTLQHTFDYTPDQTDPNYPFTGTEYEFGSGVAMDGVRIAIAAGMEDSALGAVYIYDYITFAFIERLTVDNVAEMGRRSMRTDKSVPPTGKIVVDAYKQNTALVIDMSPVI